jgi:sodium transport system permease protein
MNGARRPGVDLRTVRLVAAKELRESLRDRRTLFVALLLPVLLYPLMMLAVGPLVSRQKQKLMGEAQSVVVTGGMPRFGEVMSQVTKSDGKPVFDPDTLTFTHSDEPQADLEAGRIALWVEIDGTAADLLGDRPTRITVHRDGTSDESLAAERKFNEVLKSWSEIVLNQREDALDLPHDWHRPIETTVADVASPERRAAFLFGKMLAFVLVVLTLSSSFYPAVDAVAGEKERGTMETLLVAPCGRAELVLGKFVAVLAVTLAAATLNLASMGLTLGPLMGELAPEVGTGLVVTPPVLVGILALLVPLSALFSAVSLALSTLARSVKEAQHYLTPLFVVVMPLAMVVVLPDVPLTAQLAPLPVTNAVLFFRDLLLGKTEAGTTVLVMLSTFAYAALALWGCVALFLREETLFRGPEGGTALVSRPAPRERPGAAAAFVLFMGCMALIWYGHEALPQSVVKNVLASQLLVILLPCVALAFWIRARAATTFRFAAASPVALIAAVLIGLAMPVLNTALIDAAGLPAPSEELVRIGREMTSFVQESPFLAALLFGVLPAVCEELFFRGFILSGFTGAFRGAGAAARAVVLTSVLFAVFHIFPEKWLPTFLVGLLLGFLCARTGSIWPGMVAHAINNSSAVLREWKPLGDLAERVPTSASLPLASVAVVVGIGAVALTRPARTPET